MTTTPSHPLGITESQHYHAGMTDGTRPSWMEGLGTLSIIHYLEELESQIRDEHSLKPSLHQQDA